MFNNITRNSFRPTSEINWYRQQENPIPFHLYFIAEQLTLTKT